MPFSFDDIWEIAIGFVIGTVAITIFWGLLGAATRMFTGTTVNSPDQLQRIVQDSLTQ